MFKNTTLSELTANYASTNTYIYIDFRQNLEDYGEGRKTEKQKATIKDYQTNQKSNCVEKEVTCKERD